MSTFFNRGAGRSRVPQNTPNHEPPLITPVPFQCCAFFDSFRSSIFGVKSTKIALVGTIALTMGPCKNLRPVSTPFAKKPSDAFSSFRVPFPPLQFNVVERCGGKSRGVAFLPRESPRARDGEPAPSPVRRRIFFSTLNCKRGMGGEKSENH